MKDIGPLSYFLGIVVQCTSKGIFLNQTQYIKEIINRADTTTWKSSHTPIDTNMELDSQTEEPFPDPTHYQSLVGALIYLSFTCPNTS